MAEAFRCPRCGSLKVEFVGSHCSRDMNGVDHYHWVMTCHNGHVISASPYTRLSLEPLPDIHNVRKALGTEEGEALWRLRTSSSDVMQRVREKMQDVLSRVQGSTTEEWERDLKGEGPIAPKFRL